MKNELKKDLFTLGVKVVEIIGLVAILALIIKSF